MAKITGVDGVYFKSEGDGAALAAWYRKHLGMSLEDFGGAILRWPDDKAEDPGLTVWHVAEKDSQWFRLRAIRRLELPRFCGRVGTAVDRGPRGARFRLASPRLRTHA